MINCAVIGLGNMGKHHARIYHELPKSNLVAVTDVDPSIGKQIAERYNCQFYDDFLKMIGIEPIEAVSIAVPTSGHKEVAVNCLARGIHVLLEKPIALTVDEAIEITRVAEESGVILQVGHIEHFNPAVIKLNEILNKNAIGQLITIVVRRVGIAPPQIKDANVILDLAIHDIELCNYLTKAFPSKLYCWAGAGILPDREDYAHIFLEYDGVNAFIQSNWITPVKIRQMHLTGTKGYAEIDFITQKLFLAETIIEQDFDDYGAFVTKFGQSKKVAIPVTHAEPLKLEIESFLKCVGHDLEPEINGKRATDALRVALEAWDMSSKSR